MRSSDTDAEARKAQLTAVALVALPAREDFPWQEQVDGLVDLCTADVLALLFPDDRFDVVLCESVLTFRNDKTRAISECGSSSSPSPDIFRFAGYGLFTGKKPEPFEWPP